MLKRESVTEERSTLFLSWCGRSRNVAKCDKTSNDMSIKVQEQP